MDSAAKSHTRRENLTAIHFAPGAFFGGKSF
jgi:hypothetical protein